MASIEEKVEKLVKEPIRNLGYEIYDVQYVKEGKDYYLRILIEKENGSIDINDCERVNNNIILQQQISSLFIKFVFRASSST